MILYFSATGNSKFVAEQIAKATSDNTISIDCCNDKISIPHGERLGIVTPTYFYGLPSIVEDWLLNAQINCNADTYIYCIATCGGTSGQANKDIVKHIAKKNLVVNACFDIIMPDNWTPMCDVSDKREVAKIIETETEQIEAIVSHIQNGDNGNFAKHTTPVLIAKFAHLFYAPSRKTSHFKVEEQCICCGICEKNCPLNAIKIQDSKPVWVNDKCAMCLKCLHNCPKFAIQYGKKTKKHGQYRHP